MSTNTRQNLELLKIKVISAAGLETVTPGDCKKIAKLIYNQARICISETTLKRVYGFALSGFQPSLFTLDALAKSCGYKGWNKFCLENEHLLDEGDTDYSKEFSWGKLQRSASKVTAFTLQALKNKSGIPYSKTIKRAFIDAHFKDFDHSGLTGTIIAGPGGYGKTIAICHWIDEKLDDANDKDIVLFFSSTALISVMVSGMDINTWLQALLGYGPLNNLTGLEGKTEGKFYLIIDGFDEYRYKAEQFDILVKQLSDYVSLYWENDNFKVVLTMHDYTWCNFGNELQSAGSWHTGYTVKEEFTNIPLFSRAELNALLRNISPGYNVPQNLNLAESFKYPLYIHYYLKKYQYNLSEAFTNGVSEFEINSLFLLNKVYLGKYATEKVLLIKAIVEAMDLDSSCYKVNKAKINDTYKYPQAYKEMLCDGILKEFNEVADFKNNVYIKFTNTHFLTNSICKVLLFNNNDLLNSTLIAQIDDLLNSGTLKLPVLKYCIIYAVKTAQQNSFGCITESNLSLTEKSDMVLFMGQLFNKEFTVLKGSEFLHHYFSQNFNEKLFNYFFGIELITAEYKNTLKTLLEFELNNYNKILVFTTLGIISIINLELDELDHYIRELEKFRDADFQAFPVNTLNCLKTIHDYFKYGVIRKEALTQLTKISFNPPRDKSKLKDCPANDIVYLLGIYTMPITNNYVKTLRLINLINKTYKENALVCSGSMYAFFVEAITLDCYFRVGEKGKVSEIYNQLVTTFENNRGCLTPFMETLMHCLKIRYLLCNNQDIDIPKELTCIEMISDRWGIRLNKLFTLSLLAVKEDFVKTEPAFFKEVNFDLLKLVNSTGLNKEVFLDDNLYANNLTDSCI